MTTIPPIRARAQRSGARNRTLKTLYYGVSCWIDYDYAHAHDSGNPVIWYPMFSYRNNSNLCFLDNRVQKLKRPMKIPGHFANI